MLCLIRVVCDDGLSKFSYLHVLVCLISVFSCKLAWLAKSMKSIEVEIQ